MKLRLSDLWASYFENTAFKVAFLYACFSSLWILFSDQIVFFFIKDAQMLTSIQMLKGWLFVFVTAIIIFLLLDKDISKLKQTENILWATLHSTADGILVVDNNGKIMAVNSRFAHMWSLPPEIIAQETDDKNLLQHVLNQVEDPESFLQRVDKLYQSSADAIDEIRLTDGRLFERYSTPLVQHGSKVGRVWNFHDFTERKQAMDEKITLEERLQQSQKMEAIGTLAGGIAHDFNNILSAIFGYAELAKDDARENEELQQNLDEILHGARRAKELVKQILTFSRRDDQELKPLRMQLVVKEALKLLRSSIPTTIAIQSDIKNDCPPVLADPTQVHQVVMNICTNAYHAMRDSGGNLRVSLHPVELTEKDVVDKIALSPGSYIKLSISDTGIGMTHDMLDRIFEPYYTSKAKGEGTGLGLAVVHGIVRSYNGDVTVSSELGKGTTFHVYFPRATTLKEEVFQEDIASTLPTGNERILLVDDDEGIVKMHKMMLERLGYNVTALTGSIATLERFQHTPDDFDLVITDMTMPGMTGADLAGRILAIRPDMPIILCTGYSEHIDADKAQAIGIRDYVMKPVVKRDFAAVVRRVLNASA
ncbi:MAG: response regulator [Desulfobulbaceae bacterium]|nr:response regulator [Desulfobulbaceae bacterium]